MISSCHVEGASKTEIELIGDIARNTTPDFFHDDVNLLVLMSLLVAGISLYYAAVTYKAQKKTESNTNKLSRDAQRSLLNDLVRHMYRNLVVSYTIRTKMEESHWKSYPSEEHLLKMKIPLENIHLDVFYDNDDDFRAMHELYLNMRNYNEELDVILSHFVNPGVSETTRKRDQGILEFKAFYIVERIESTEYSIWGDTKAVKSQMEAVMTEVVREKCSSSGNIPVEGYSDAFRKVGPEFFENTSMARLYIESGVGKLASEFNIAVAIERGLNNRREEKVHMIGF